MLKNYDRILLVDDEIHVIAALQRVLMDEPYLVTGCTSAAEALEVMKRERFKVVISDERMPFMDGAEFLSLARVRYPEMVRIMLTGHASVEATMRAVNSGEIYRFFTKPWDDLELALAIRGALEKYDLELENRRLLATVRRQSLELRWVEEKYPGISKVVRDEQGAIALDTISDDDIAAIIEACNHTV